MSQELLEHRYHARDLQLAAIDENTSTVIDAEFQLIQRQISILHYLLQHTDPTELPHAISEIFHNSEDQRHTLQTAIQFQLDLNFTLFLFQTIRTAAEHRATLTAQLENNPDFAKILPDYQPLLPLELDLKLLVASGTARGAERFIQAIGVQIPVTNPRRDLAQRIYPNQAFNNHEVVLYSPSAVEGILLKLFYPQGQDFPQRYIYIRTLD